MLSITSFLFGLLLAAALGSRANQLGRLLGVMDEPKGHKQHLLPTPAVGGVIAGIVAATNFFLAALGSDFADGLGARSAAFTAVLAMMVIGFLDDRRHLPATLRLALSVVIFSILLTAVPALRLQHVAFPSINFDFSLGAFAVPFTILCLVGLKNAVNMVDGRNGLLLGLSLIWQIFFVTRSLPSMLPTTLCLTGCFLALFVLNWRGKLFMGDCGSYGIATYAGLLSLALHANAFGNVLTSEVVLLFLIPVLDTLRLIIIRCSEGRSPLAPDNRHLHHLLDQAMGWRRGWLVYMCLVAAPIVFNQLATGYGVYMIMLGCMLYALFVWQLSAREDLIGDAIAAE